MLTGLGFQSASKLGAPPFVQNAYSQGIIRENAFGLRLDGEQSMSELFIGGANPSLYEGRFETHAVAAGAQHCERAMK